jgi:uncharacterized protein (DUF2235 family)
MPKNIIICSDGTGNSYGENNTNVVKLYEAIDKKSQCTFYDPGVGTLPFPYFSSTLYRAYKKLIGLAFGYGITQNIEDAYRFLMEYYEEGDKVFLFGFSRGAFTVRALAGMIYKVGLLKKGSNNLVSYASQVYRKKNNKDIADGFKSTFCINCDIHFIGVWDTVKSVGLILPRKFPDAVLNKKVAYARQALAIDEKRWIYTPCIWDTSNNNQDIEQQWFAGAHSDIGGSYKKDGLSNISLHWIAKEAEKCGIKIDSGKLNKYQPDSLGKLHNSLIPLWWILLWRKRKICPDNIHPSVHDRMKQTNYKPQNLLKVIKNTSICK